MRKNQKFKLSDMLPNAWFYKLRDMGKPRNPSSTATIKKKPFQDEKEQPQFTNHRHSYYFTSEPFSYKADKLYNSPVNPKSTDVHFPDLPRNSFKVNSRGRRRRSRSIKSSSSSSTKFVSSVSAAGCSCRDSMWAKPDSTPEYSASASPSPPDSSPEQAFANLGSDPDLLVSWSSSCSCRVSSSTADIILDMDIRNSANGIQKIDKFDGLDSISGLELLPIRTKPAKFNDMVSEIKKRDTKNTEDTVPVKYQRSSVKVDEKRVTESVSVKEETIKTRKEQRNSPSIRRISQSSPGLKLRSHSPRIASKKIQAYSRKSISSAANTKTRKKNLSDSFAIIKSSLDPQRDFRESMVEMIVENNIRAAKDLEELLACYLSLNSNEYHDIIVKVFEQIWFDLTDIKL